ncbi:cation:proton antiporter [Oricola thermophila]|uniref:Cation:proton antiporter n=1 Tax=Oricola thermophila TaxID=2742145 RepID=A0A6N1VHT7_9HYPH|nr:cation:proton antiporter [Oricola thermophila]QKV18557.1 cation:proton antiporter [Oricola thermophila]
MENSESSLLVALAILFLLGLALDKLGRIVHVPRVTLLILLGAVLGPPVLDILPGPLASADHVYADAALTMVAFLLGGTLNRKTLSVYGAEILVISVTLAAVSVAVVWGGLVLLGVPIALAAVLGGISAATDPAATHDVVRASGAKGRFVSNILGIVAVDDAWGLIAFSIVITIAGTLTGNGAVESLMHGFWEVGGAIILGAVIGVPSAYLTGRLKPGEPTLVEAVGIVLLCAGTALYLEVSFLLTGMVCGAAIVNLARHHDQPFHEIERIEWPFILVFFVMAGASLEVGLLDQIGWIGLAYVAMRILARLAGGSIGGRLAGLPARESLLMGTALMPQAGVAIGMALVAEERFPEFGSTILAIAIASTIVFEVIGPICTQIAISMTRDRQ